LWKEEGGFQLQNLSADLNRAEINAVEVAAGQIWFGNHQLGLYRWPMGGGQPPVSVAFGAKQVASLFRHGSSLFIGSESGLLRVNLSDIPWDPKVRIAALEPRNPRPGERIQLKWEITNYEERTSPDLVSQRVEMLDNSGEVVVRQDVKPSLFELVLQAPQQSGDYRLRFVANDFAGREAVSEPAGAIIGVAAPGTPMSSVWVIVGALVLASVGGLLAVRRFRRPDNRQIDQGRKDGLTPVHSGREENGPTAPVAVSPPRVEIPRPESNVRTTGSPERKLKVFVCYFKADESHVRKIYYWLQNIGADPWLDVEKLLPGDDWAEEITSALSGSDAVLVCLSKGSVSKSGFREKEFRFAMDLAEERGRGIVLMPVKLEECQPPIGLRHLQWVNLFEEKGYGRLFAALQARANALGIQLVREGFDPPAATSSS
jgi:hypothetical protein